VTFVVTSFESKVAITIVASALGEMSSIVVKTKSAAAKFLKVMIVLYLLTLLTIKHDTERFIVEILGSDQSVTPWLLLTAVYYSGYGVNFIALFKPVMSSSFHMWFCQQ
jgi:hypothetical protein